MRNACELTLLLVPHERQSARLGMWIDSMSEPTLSCNDEAGGLTFNRPLWKMPERLALLKLSSIGDVVLASGVPHAIKLANPDCEITWVVERRCAELVEANPFVDDLIVVEDASLGALRRAGVELRRREFDTILDLQGIIKSALLLRMSGARRRVTGSFARPFAKRAATEVVDCGSGHAAELYLRCAGAPGGDLSAAQLVAPITEADRKFADEFLAVHSPLTMHHSPLIGLNPGASRADKRWPPERFASVADALVDEFGARVILFGAPSDRAIAEAVKSTIRHPVIDAVGKTTLRQLAALAERCAVFITNDTGPMHLAAAAGTRVVGLFGASDPNFTGPWGVGHVVFWKADSFADAKRRGEELLRAVTVDEVIEACEKELQRTERGNGGNNGNDRPISGNPSFPTFPRSAVAK